MSDIIPWATTARLVEFGGEETRVGTLRGCVRAWSFVTEQRQGAISIECDLPIRLADWPSPECRISSVKIAELLLRISW